MWKKDGLEGGTAEEIREMLRSQGGSRTDWAALAAMSQEEVERLADEEDGPLPEGWEKTVINGLPPGLFEQQKKQDVHIRLDVAVLRWFKAAGPGYQTRINAVLKAFVAAQGMG